MLALTLQGGICNCNVPDTCQTPTPVGPTPIPYPNMFQCNMVTPSTACQKVFVCGAAALHVKSATSMSNGDEAGNAGGGVVSAKFIGKGEFINGSLKITLEGQAAVSQCAPTKHNEGNTMGMNSASAQTKVFFDWAFPFPCDC